jgi:SNF family Na+-dependent transporter
MIFILIIRGATLPGAGVGMEFYILNVDMEKLATLQVQYIYMI